MGSVGRRKACTTGEVASAHGSDRDFNPAPEQLSHFFHRDDADWDLIKKLRGNHMRLGFAAPLCAARFPETFLDDRTDVPADRSAVRGQERRMKPLDRLCRFPAPLLLKGRAGHW